MPGRLCMRCGIISSMFDFFGFSRTISFYCDQCGHDQLLAYSRETRCFRLTCHQKLVFTYCRWLKGNLPAPLPHRQYVFVLPKLIRPFLRYRRSYLGQLSCHITELLMTGYMPWTSTIRPPSFCACRPLMILTGEMSSGRGYSTTSTR